MADIERQIDACMLRDRHPLRRQLRKISRAPGADDDDAAPLRRLAGAVASSVALVERRASSVPAHISFPAELPIAARREQIAGAISAHQVVIVAGETGSGKTTQLPKICMQLGRGVTGLIGHTQPRRLAARTVAARIAEELDTPLGEGVGYQVRFTEQVADSSHIKLMTDGILLAEIQQDRFLNRYDTIIIDEAHERSLNIDFLLGYLKNLLPKRPDLKLIVTSATIDVEAFSRHFDGAPIIEVSGRTFAVDVHYLPVVDDAGSAGLAEQVLAGIDYLLALESGGRGQRGGDVLVFLPGERDIRECALLLRRQLGGADRRGSPADWDILPLYARLGRAEQARVFSPRGRRGRRVVLATNVAETSLTVPGIRYVIDSGLARIDRYSHRSRVQRLPIEPIARANAEQRKGRCGRVGPGTCVRLYSEADFDNRPAYTDSQIQRTNLASVILQLTTMRFGDVSTFPFLEAPDNRLVRDGYQLLEELGAIDGRRRTTPVGRSLARIPADPRIARMLLAADRHACLREVLIIAAALSIQDPRERPLEKRQAADQAHARFACPESDFLALIRLWEYFEQQRQQLSKNQLRKLCQREFLSSLRLFEWRDIHHQLRLACQRLGLGANSEPATQGAVHRAVLAGLVSQVGQRDTGREYRGTRNRRFQLFPGSSLARRPPPWVVATELVDTGTLYARVNGRIEPEWLVEAAPQLIRRNYSEPHYSRRRRSVVATETLSFHGLVLSEGGKVSYGAIDPQRSRELFIRAALVEGLYPGRAAFWRHNRGLIEEIRELETRNRRHDLLVDEEDLFDWYDARLPADIWSVAAFDKWRRGAEIDNARLLYLSREQLLRRDPGDDAARQFPHALDIDGVSLALSYCFDPGNEADGVTVTLPLALIKRVPAARFEWLVPGMLRDKCIELVKALPKPIRKRFVPVPAVVDRALAQMEPGAVPLTRALGEALKRLQGQAIPASAWRPDKVDAFYQMNFDVVDADGRSLATGRDLAELAASLQAELVEMVAQIAPGTSPGLHRRWDFGEYRSQQQLSQGGVSVPVYTAIADRGDAVALEAVDDRCEAAERTRLGLARLCLLALPKPARSIRKQLAADNRLQLRLSSLGEVEQLREHCLLGVFVEQFVRHRAWPENADAFDALLRQHRGGLAAQGQRYQAVLQQIAERHFSLRAALSELSTKSWQYVADDVEEQLAELLFDGFLCRLPLARLQHYPRYLHAIEHRLGRLAGHEHKDRAATAEISRHRQRLAAQCADGRLWRAQDTPLEAYRWLLEEYRVSLFAQPVGAVERVSGKRLDQLWAALQAGG